MGGGGLEVKGLEILIPGIGQRWWRWDDCPNRLVSPLVSHEGDVDWNTFRGDVAEGKRKKEV